MVTNIVHIASVAAACSWALLGVSEARAATLPPHASVDVLIISDYVNPSGLSAAELTEPGDLLIALSQAGTGINTSAVAEVGSDCVDAALTALQGATPPDVLIYFAHMSAAYCGGGSAQVELTAAIEAFLQGGGGVVVFHHGLYQDAGKAGILDLLGATAGGAVNWNTTVGQDVINLAPSHFVTTNGVTYSDTIGFGLPAYGVPNGTYDRFVNVPDEAYTNFTENVVAGETRTYLFGSSQLVAARPLGYELVRPGWAGRVVAYQPGEYQPNALDDLDGNNFQILANAIVWSADALLPPVVEEGPEPMPEPSPEPMPEPMPEAMPEPMPEAMPEPMPEAMPEPMPEPAPEPMPEPAPEPGAEPQPEGAPEDVPGPELQPEPAPEPGVEPAAEPTPEAQVEPAPEVAPEAQPEVAPDLAAEAAPEPGPEPVPEPTPDTAPPEVGSDVASSDAASDQAADPAVPAAPPSGEDSGCASGGGTHPLSPLGALLLSLGLLAAVRRRR